MATRWRWISVTAVAVLVWLGLAYRSGPPDPHDYRRTAVQSAQAPPDAATRALRDELTPLLVEAARRIGDLDLAASAGDDAGIDAVVAGLRQVGDQLADFVERHR